jgi:hypothetical protein
MLLTTFPITCCLYSTTLMSLKLITFAFPSAKSKSKRTKTYQIRQLCSYLALRLLKQKGKS